MQGAMDRFLTVNDSSGSTDFPEPQQPQPLGSDATGGRGTGSDGTGDVDSSDDEEPLPPAVAAASGGSQGPCLYFGPQGQRCSRPALVGGFCSRHLRNGDQPNAEGPRPAPSRLPKIAVAGIGILAALWPIIFDILRVIVRWIHAHG
jgi:hypothetical protein